MPTYVPPVKSKSAKWHVIDANGKVLGRVATSAAKILQGKHTANYTPYLDMGDHVVILNVAKVKLTGRKADQKQYFRHSGYMGHEQFIPYRKMLAAHPERVIEMAVKGMMPKTRLGKGLAAGALAAAAGGTALALRNRDEKPSRGRGGREVRSSALDTLAEMRAQEILDKGIPRLGFSVTGHLAVGERVVLLDARAVEITTPKQI